MTEMSAVSAKIGVKRGSGDAGAQAQVKAEPSLVDSLIVIKEVDNGAGLDARPDLGRCQRKFDLGFSIENSLNHPDYSQDR
jgi:hypothetical protein